MEPNRPIQQNQQVVKKNSGTLWTIIGVIIIIAVIVAIYFITQKSVKNSDTTNDTPVAELDNQEMGDAVKAQPKALVVTNLGTFPYKVQAKVSFDLPSSCSVARAGVAQSGKTFTVDVTASQPNDALCAQVITPSSLTVNIPVAGLAAGTYTVTYEGMTKTFTLAQNNQVEYTSDK